MDALKVQNPPDWRKLAEDAWSSPSCSWAEAAREYHDARAGRRAVVEIEPERLAQLRRLMANDISLERAWRELNSPRRLDAPQATVEALIFGLRDGVAALSRPETLRRLAALSDAQLLEVSVRVQKFKPNIAPSWTPEEVQALAIAKGQTA